MRFVELLDERADLRAKNPLHRPLLGRDHMHGESPRAKRGCHLQADKAGADDDCLLYAGSPGDDRLAVGHAAQIVDMRSVATRHRQTHGLGACGDEQRAEGNAPTLDVHAFVADVDLGHFRAQPQVDPLVGVEIGSPQRHPVFFSGAGQIVLGQVGSIVWRRVVFTQQGDSAIVALTPKHLGGGESGAAAPYDDDGLRQAAGLAHVRANRWPVGQLLTDKHRFALAFGSPAGDRVERGCTDGLARLKAEARVVPRAAHGVLDDQSLCQRPLVVRAVCADRKNLVATPNDDDFIVADMPVDDGIVIELGQRNAGGEIARRSRLIHRTLSLRQW